MAASRLVSAGRGMDGTRARFGAALQALDGTRARFGAPPPRCCQAQHLAASRLVSAGRGSTSGSGRYPSAFRGPVKAQHLGASRLVSAGRGSTSGVSGAPPPLMLPGAALGLAPTLLDAARRSTFEPRGSFLLAKALQALDGTRARFGAPPLRRSTWQPRGSFLLAGAALQALDGRCCQAQHLAASRLVSAGRGSTSGSGRYPSAFRGPPLDAARRSTWEPRGWFWTVPERLAARFCWQGQHFRLWTVPERVSGPFS